MYIAEVLWGHKKGKFQWVISINDSRREARVSEERHDGEVWLRDKISIFLISSVQHASTSLSDIHFFKWYGWERMDGLCVCVCAYGWMHALVVIVGLKRAHEFWWPLSNKEFP